MGVFTDAALAGHEFRPSAYELAELLYAWDPRDPTTPAPDVPPSAERTLFPWTVTNGRNTRIDLSEHCAWKFKRIFGYIASIDETDALNANTGFRFEVVTSIPYRADGCSNEVDRLSYLHCRVRAFSSNLCSTSVFALLTRFTPDPPFLAQKFVLTDAVSIMLGTPVSGIVSAAYNGRGRAVLEAWAPVTDMDHWRLSSPRTLPPMVYTDLDEWTLSWLPTLGGAPFAELEPNEAPSYCVFLNFFVKRIMVDMNRIVSCRLRPPIEDTFLFLRTRRAALNEADAAGVDPPADTGARHRGRSVQFRDVNYVRPRGRSARRRNP